MTERVVESGPAEDRNKDRCGRVAGWSFFSTRSPVKECSPSPDAEPANSDNPFLKEEEDALSLSVRERLTRLEAFSAA